jgi:Na+-driven multidrug efflux pump
MDIIGISIAGIITNSITFLILKIFKNTRSDLKETIVPFFGESTFDKEGLMEYFWLGAPYMLINFLDYWTWELMTLSAGILGVEDQACQVILINILAFCYMFGSGMQTTTCALVGNQIGRGDAVMAIKTFKEVAIVSTVFFGIIVVIMHRFFGELL